MAALEVPAGFVATTIDVDDEREVRIFVKQLTPEEAAALRGLVERAEAHVRSQESFRPTSNLSADELRSAVDCDVAFVEARDEMYLRRGVYPQLLAALLRLNAAAHT